ncbi:MAG: transporter [Candidatus Thiothrix putei]|uniref:Transporter n=1 Tax=Candidatus Thiothrix putei TaxID=3080811 RepID=A0AA95KK88_9GAMM|nr:MAG: transporter [Candidatus Thiothrix putei]
MLQTIKAFFLSALLLANVVYADEVTKADSQIIGQSPSSEEEINRLFLRDSEVLLKPKKLQVSIGIGYATDESQQNFRESRTRQASIPVGVSYGLADSLEVSASLPFQYLENQVVSVTDVSKETESGIGDLALGAKYKIKTESATTPSVTAALGVSIPTGEGSNPDSLNDLTNSSGLLSTSLGFSLAKTIDPAFVFVNAGYTHTFDDEQYGYNVKLGESFNYGFGTGLAVNSAVAFSGRVSGSYQKESQVNQKTVNGSSSEPIDFVGAMSYRFSSDTNIETSLNIGLTDDAQDVGVGVTVIKDIR